MGLRSSREERQKNIVQNPYLEDTEKGMQLIASLISMPEKKEETLRQLENLNKVIKYDFLDLCTQDTLPNEAEMYQKLLEAFNHLEDLTEFHALANKNVVAVGGGFSAGKSQFLNSLIGETILPTETTPTTSIPTYIADGDVEQIYAVNAFNHKIKLDRQAILAISHAFHKKYNVSFSHIIKNLAVQSPKIRYENIAFLDTPGYSKSDSLNKADNTDEKIAREHLKLADYLIWLVDISKGTIPESDIKFIKELKFDRPIFFVLNKADLKLESEVIEVAKLMNARLKKEGIEFEAIATYNSFAKTNHEIGGNYLSEYLHKINSRAKWTTIRQEFKKVFETYMQYDQNQISTNKKELELLNKTALNVSQYSQEGLSNLQQMIAKRKKVIKKHKRLMSKFQELSNSIDGIVANIVKAISVKEENKEETGIVGFATLRNEDKLIKLKEGEKLSSKVVKVTAFGVFLDAGWGDQIMIYIDDIKSKTSNDMSSLISVGDEKEIEIINIDRVKKTVKIVMKLVYK